MDIAKAKNVLIGIPFIAAFLCDDRGYSLKKYPDRNGKKYGEKTYPKCQVLSGEAYMGSADYEDYFRDPTTTIHLKCGEQQVQIRLFCGLTE